MYMDFQYHRFILTSEVGVSHQKSEKRFSWLFPWSGHSNFPDHFQHIRRSLLRVANDNSNIFQMEIVKKNYFKMIKKVPWFSYLFRETKNFCDLPWRTLIFQVFPDFSGQWEHCRENRANAQHHRLHKQAPWRPYNF